MTEIFFYFAGQHGYVLCTIAISGIIFFHKMTANLRERLTRLHYYILSILFVLSWVLTLVLVHDPVMVNVTQKEKRNVLKVLFDSSGSVMTRGDTPWNLAYKNRGQLFHDIGAGVQVEFYTFDKAIREMDLNDILIPQKSGKTDLYHALKTVIQKSDQENIQCIVFTDGQTPWESQYWNDLIHTQATIHTVGLGSVDTSQDEFDVSISYFSAPSVARKGDTVNIAYKIEKTGGDNRPVILKVFANDAEIQNRILHLTEVKSHDEDTFSLKLAKEGTLDLIMELKPLEGESDILNNRSFKRIQVSKVSPKILWIQEELNFDFSTVLSWIKKNSAVEIDYIVKVAQNDWKISSKKLKQGEINPLVLNHYQSIWIMGDPLAYLSDTDWDHVLDYISLVGGNVVFYPNKQFADNMDRFPPSLRTCLPITSNDFAMQLQQDDIQMDAEMFSGFAKISHVYFPLSVKQNANVLVKGSGQKESVYGIVVEQKIGKGKAKMITARGLWNLDMNQNIQGEKDSARLVGTLDILSKVTDSDALAHRKEWKIERHDVEINEWVEIEWEGYLKSVNSGEFFLRASQGNEILKETAVFPESLKDNAFTLQTRMNFDKSGKTLLQLVQSGMVIDKYEINVLEHDTENTVLTLNKSLLQEMSARTGGKYYDQNEFLEKIKPLTWQKEMFEIYEEKKIRENAWVMLSLILLLCAGFFLKRSMRIP